MTTESMRERFEAWFSCGDIHEFPELFFTLDSGDYEMCDVQDAWDAWKAATLAERERCAMMLERMNESDWSSTQCAEAVRKGK